MRVNTNPFDFDFFVFRNFFKKKKNWFPKFPRPVIKTWAWPYLETHSCCPEGNHSIAAGYLHFNQFVFTRGSHRGIVRAKLSVFPGTTNRGSWPLWELILGLELGLPALVAQRIEHLTTDQKVGGSSPSERANPPRISRLGGFFRFCLC